MWCSLMVNLLEFAKFAFGLLTEKFAFLLKIPCVLLPVRIESRKMFKISIDPKIEGIYSRKSVHNGDEKVGHIYSP